MARTIKEVRDTKAYEAEAKLDKSEEEEQLLLRLSPIVAEKIRRTNEQLRKGKRLTP